MSERPAFHPSDAADQIQPARHALRHIGVLAFASILLGLVMQGLILFSRLVGGGEISGTSLLVDVAQGVTWSLFACVGVGVATLLTKARAVIAGLMSMLFAPIALGITRSSQKVVASMVGAAENPAVLSVGAISALKAVEYGLLGWLLAMLVQRDTDRAAPYLGTGAAIGAVFGGMVVMLSHRVAQAGGSPLAPPQTIAMTINETVFPVGCALVIYVGRIVSQNLSAIGR